MNYVPGNTHADAPDQMLAEAIGLHQRGCTAEAAELYRAILAAPSVHATASYSLGLLHLAEGQLREAVVAFGRAIAIRRDFADAYVNLGTTLLALGQQEAALTMYKGALAIDPGSAMAHGNLGKALQDLGRLDEAVAAYRAALRRQPDNAVAQANLGAVLLEKGDWEESVEATQRAVALRPDSAMAHANLAAAQLKLGRHEEALAACRDVIGLQPQDPAVLASLGGALLELGAFQAAAEACQQAVELNPGLAVGWFNLGHACKALNRLDEAAAAGRRAVALRPNSAEYHFSLAHVLLLRGDLQAGWDEYEWRWALPDFTWLHDFHGSFAQPRWLGEDISGQTILVHTEQGIGDMIQFARYLPELARRAGHVILATHPAVERLLSRVDGVTTVSVWQQTLPLFDVHCPLMSLPRAFGTRLDSIPAGAPYLHAEDTARRRWAGRLGAGGGVLRVGIVWAGNPATRRDRFRSPGLAAVATLFAVPGVQFVALQVGPGRDDLAGHKLPDNVLDLGGEIADLDDTAAIMSGLDLMISSCTAPLHLAGALGVRTWAMIPFAPHFPWLLERTDTLWYPTVTLYRQEAPGLDWSGVVSRMAADLAELAHAAPIGVAAAEAA